MTEPTPGAVTPTPGVVTIGAADPGEYAAIGRLTVAAYLDAGGLTVGDAYADILADTGGRAAQAALFAAHDGSGRLVGTVTTARAGRPYADLAQPGELEFRMLAVDASARGLGIGTALVDHCDRVARDGGEQALVLCVIETNRGALAFYDRLGFVREPGRDRTTSTGGRRLLAYVRAVRPGVRSGPGPRAPG